MNKRFKSYVFLAIWVVTLIAIGFGIGYLTHPELDTWYSGLHRSFFTPPNYIFPIAWTLLYALIGLFGWMVWNDRSSKLILVQKLYLGQLVLNWAWTPLFFGLHMPGVALICLIAMDMLVAAIIYVSYQKNRWASFIMVPYFVWILFATYLNFYIWQFN